MLNEDDARLAIVVELSDFEIEALNGEAPETSPLPLVSLKSESRGIVQHQQVQKSVDTRKLVDETVSIENVQHGVRGAKTLWNWGFARVVEQARASSTKLHVCTFLTYIFALSRLGCFDKHGFGAH